MEARKVFINLLGEEVIKKIEANNKDWDNSNICFFSVIFNEDKNKWIGENCIECQYPKFDSYEEMKLHIESLKNAILNNSFKLAYLP